MLKYNGKGFLPGVPARNLSEEEVQVFVKKDLTKSGLYEEVKEYKETKKIVVEEDENDRN